ncbi:MAG: CoA-binding protein [Candidatus Sedimenticola endophacoides]
MNDQTSHYREPIRCKGISEFPHYFVGIDNLARFATQNDRICVLNILGNESRTVTPTSHVYSGGNVVCGVQPGRSGSVLKTELNDIPVYNTVAEALAAGHKFNVAVVYVPPASVKDAVIEAVRVNQQLVRVIILTEKVPLSDARVIRQYCQLQGVDVFGGNCLGVADAHHHVRIGGALGGSHPAESLVPGSVAIYSNSGNFTTTIAVYLQTAGWGTTVSLSSGKDVYIHFAAPEFTNAFHNDSRSRAAVMYIEPGGYYEQDLAFEKPVIACVVGRWKDRLTKACGHAGAVAGSGDNAAAKEKWFMDKFEVDSVFTADNPVCSAKGAVVTNISDIPAAMTAVMSLNGRDPDFPPIGDLGLKCWLADDSGLQLPPDLDVRPVTPVEPYKEQIEAVNRQIGVIPPRESMKDASGASMMDPTTQVTRLQGISILDLATHPYEDNLVLALVREYPDDIGHMLANIVLNTYVNLHGTLLLEAAQAARDAGNSPNTALTGAIAMLGPNVVGAARHAVETLLALFRESGLSDPSDTNFDLEGLLSAVGKDQLQALTTSEPDADAEAMLAAAAACGVSGTVFLRFLSGLSEQRGIYLSADAVLAAVCLRLAWRPLVHKRISVATLSSLPWHLRIAAAMVGASTHPEQHLESSFGGVTMKELTEDWSFTETAYLALLGRRPNDDERFEFTVLLGLTASNGPGTISAQGAKGSVSADGPEVPERVQVNKAYVGFLTHTGFAHGGNGFEAMQFLIERFGGVGLTDPGDPAHDLDLVRIAAEYTLDYKAYKTKAAGNLSYAKIPCVNHPVFKGKEVNLDPREVYVRDLFKSRNSYNLFLEFYHELVQALASYGVSSNVYCVNIDAVIAVILLKMLWKPYSEGKVDARFLENAAFTVFLYARVVGEAAEIEDHATRGRNMDTRTPASRCRFVG